MPGAAPGGKPPSWPAGHHPACWQPLRDAGCCLGCGRNACCSAGHLQVSGHPQHSVGSFQLWEAPLACSQHPRQREPALKSLWLRHPLKPGVCFIFLAAKGKDPASWTVYLFPPVITFIFRSLEGVFFHTWNLPFPLLGTCLFSCCWPRVMAALRSVGPWWCHTVSLPCGDTARSVQGGSVDSVLLQKSSHLSSTS